MKVGFAISGNGFKATAYALGVFSYFNHLQLDGKPFLLKVDALSTVSGASIIAATYPLSVKHGLSFSDYFSIIYDYITDPEFVESSTTEFKNDFFYEALLNRILSESSINSITQSKIDGIEKIKLSDLCPTKQDNGDSDLHLNFNCIHSTIYGSGLPFRFVAKSSNINADFLSDSVFSNSKADFSTVPLSSIIKIASVFKIDTTPVTLNLNDYIFDYKNDLKNEFDIIYQKNPEDFTDYHTELNSFINKFSIVGLTNGVFSYGQELESLFLYDNELKRTNKKELDLVFLIEASSPNFFELDVKNDFNVPIIGRLKYVYINCFFLFLQFLSFLTIAYYYNKQFLLGVLASSIIMTLLFTINFFLLLGKKRLIKSNQFYNDFLNLDHRINSLTINKIVRLFKNRMCTIDIVINRMFEKQLYRKGYFYMFSDSNFNRKTIYNTLYHLKEKTAVDQRMIVNFFNLPSHFVQPSIEMKKICSDAFNLQISQSFEKDKKYIKNTQTVIIAAQMTSCASLLEYCWREINEFNHISHKSDDTSDDIFQQRKHFIEQLSIVFHQLQLDWDCFVKNPYWMLEKENYKIEYI